MKKVANDFSSEFPKRINSVRKRGLSAQWLWASVLESDTSEVETLPLHQSYRSQARDLASSGFIFLL